MSTYPPRECGIGTFTRDLAEALARNDAVGKNYVVAVDEEAASRKYDSTVKFILKQDDQESYRAAAEFLNDSKADVINLQHEYGIFGGDWGEHVLELAGSLRKPLVTTMHTVLSNPSPKALQVTRDLAAKSKYLVVAVKKAANYLERIYDVPAKKIKIIHHGAPQVRRKHKEGWKKFLGIEDRLVLSTFGLINPGKGIEYAIEALGNLVPEYPGLLYLVIGETHPEVKKRFGESYREKLQGMLRELRLGKNVRFIDKFLSEDELDAYMQATDIYLAPYLGKEQISSGTLTRALSYGKAIISTPTVFALEILANHRGMFCEFQDTASIADCVRKLLANPEMKQRLENNAFKYGRGMEWNEIARQYGSLLSKASGIKEAI